MNVATAQHDDIVYPSAIPFPILHVASAAVVVSGVMWQAVGLWVALYGLRMSAIGAAYHRYFSHRAFRTSRRLERSHTADLLQWRNCG